MSTLLTVLLAGSAALGQPAPQKAGEPPIQFSVRGDEERVLFRSDEAVVFAQEPPRNRRYTLKAQGVKLSELYSYLLKHADLRYSEYNWLMLSTAAAGSTPVSIDVEDASPWELFLEIAKASGLGAFGPPMTALSDLPGNFDITRAQHQVRGAYLVVLKSTGEGQDAERELVVLRNESETSDSVDEWVTLKGVRADGTTKDLEPEVVGMWSVPEKDLAEFVMLQGSFRTSSYPQILRVEAKPGAEFEAAGLRFAFAPIDPLAAPKAREEPLFITACFEPQTEEFRYGWIQFRSVELYDKDGRQLGAGGSWVPKDVRQCSSLHAKGMDLSKLPGGRVVVKLGVIEEGVEQFEFELRPGATEAREAKRRIEAQEAKRENRRVATRRLLLGVAAVSLLLFVALAALWMRSYARRSTTRRLVYDALTALSLLLFVAVLALWVRSYWRADIVMYVKLLRWQAHDSYHVWSHRGMLSFDRRQKREDDTIRREPEPGLRWQSIAPFNWSGLWAERGILGFSYEYEALGQRGPESSFHIGLPYWFVALVVGMPPALLVRAAVRSRRQERRQKAGLCPACGYDLRASPDRCPECGMASEKPEGGPPMCPGHDPPDRTAGETGERARP